jgi:hypothetical protein
VGPSAYSNTVTILAAQIPNTPGTPTTTVNSQNVIVTWTAPSNGGSAITAYTITLRQIDGVTYSQDLLSCNGANAAVISALMCTIPFATLQEAPFNLVWGSSVFAKVTATNIIGVSQSSPAGNGAMMTRAPDAPINLVQEIASNAINIFFSW